MKNFFRNIIFFVNGNFSIDYINFLVCKGLCFYVVYKQQINIRLNIRKNVRYIEYNDLFFIKNKSLFKLFIVFDFGFKLDSKLFNFPKLGTYVIHPSYLPNLSGPDPIRNFIFYNKKYSGLSIFRIDKGIDSGDIYLREKIFYYKKLNYSDIRNNFNKKVLLLTYRFIKDIFTKKVRLLKQIRNVFIKKSKIFDKENYIVNWNESSEIIYKKSKCFFPFLKILLFKKVFFLLECKCLTSASINVKPGKIFVFNFRIYIICRLGILKVNYLKINGKIISSRDFINGYLCK